MSEIVGTVQGHRDGHGFVQADDGDASVFLPPQEMRSVMHRDRVKVRVVRFDRRGRPEGLVLDIIERRKTPIIGRLLQEGGAWLVAPEDRRFGQDILISPKGTANAEPGQVVAVELTEAPSLLAKPVGRVVEVLGGIDDPGMEIEIAVRKYEVPHRFSDATLAQAAKLPEKVRATDKKQRIDLTDVSMVTIDGEDARDFDDAVYCEPATIGRAKAPNGWRLLVAIADVSHYVKPGEPLDLDAYERATSVYFPRRVIPMLPEKLSNGLCSLNPDVERLSMVCDMLVTADGDVHAYQFFPAVIRSHARLTYTEVAAILGNTRGPEALRRPELLPHLLHLHEVYRALLKSRSGRGAVDFDTTETQIVCDDNGRIAKIVPRVRTDAHRLIEECMLAANVATAAFMQKHEIPALYRVHDCPPPERVEKLKAFLTELGLSLHRGKSKDGPSPKDYQLLLESIRERPDYHLIQTVMLRSLSQAVYSADNQGHFGLNYEAYAHFTSPIRRYPDLLIHRAIRSVVRSKLDTPHVKRAGAAIMPRARIYPYDDAILEQLGEQCSMSERRADEATRDVVNWLKCEFMKDRVGETFPGVITAVTGFGLFVELKDIYVEGLVHVTALPGDYYHFDPVHHRLAGERSGRSFRLGDSVEVKVMRVDLDERKIDFELAEGKTAMPAGQRRGGFESAAGKTGRRGERAAPGNTDVEKSRALKKSLLSDSKSKAGKGAAKSESAKPASKSGKPSAHRKGAPAGGAPASGGARKRKAKS